MFTIGEWNVDLLDLGHVINRMSVYTDLEPGVDDNLVVNAYNVLLLRQGTTTVVVDTGVGVTAAALGLPVTDLTGALAALDVSPEAVDIVCLTHLDYDHIGGAFAGSWPDDLRPVFVDAEVMVSAEEIEWSRAGASGIGFEGGPVAVAALDPSLSAIAPGAEIVPGVHMRPAPGHTPGHMVVEIDGDPPLLFLADVLHAGFLAEQPRPVRFDRDPQRGVETRFKLLEECADRQLQVLSTHISAESPGRIVRSDSGYRWESG